MAYDTNLGLNGSSRKKQHSTAACLFSNLAVPKGLPCRQGAVQMVLSLGGQLRLNFLLGPPQHERPQHLRHASAREASDPWWRSFKQPGGAGVLSV